MEHEAELKAILKQVDLLTADEKHWLGSRILASASSPKKTKRPSFGDLIGIANPARRNYTDEQIDQIRFEALKEKHLR